MYPNVNAGQSQLFVSRRMTASVEAHWQHRAKNTISDRAAIFRGRLPERLAEWVGQLVGFALAQVVEDAQRADDDFPCGEAGQRRGANLPIPAQRLYRRLKSLAHAAQHALPLPRAAQL